MYSYLKEKLSKLDSNKVILRFEDKKITINKFIKEIDALAGGLKELGIKDGDVVCWNLPNTVNAIVLFYAVNKLGAIANIVHPLVPAEALKETVIKTNSKLLFTMDFFYDKNKEVFKDINCPIIISYISDYLPAIKAFIYKKTKEIKAPKGLATYKSIFRYGLPTQTVSTEIATYLHSGGTTGKSKTIMLTTKSFNELADSLYLCVEEKDQNPDTNRSLMVLPLFHGFGLGVCMHTLISCGFETSIMPRFNAKKASEIIKKRKITYVAGVPLMYRKLLSLSDKEFSGLKTLRNLFCGGDKLTAELKKEFDDRFKKIGGESELQEGYGLTETVTVCTLNKRNDWQLNSMGYAIKGAELGILDENGELKYSDAKGEICVSGVTLMAGYLDNDNDNMFENDGKIWVRTGDYGMLNKNRKLFLIDRIKRMFIRSGINIFPAEIEQIVNEVSYVKESVVVYKEEKDELRLYVGIPDIEIRNAETIKNDILNECRKKLIVHSIPSKVIIEKALPKTAVGKIDFGKLKNKD